jgi:hypothetical protein
MTLQSLSCFKSRLAVVGALFALLMVAPVGCTGNVSIDQDDMPAGPEQMSRFWSR